MKKLLILFFSGLAFTSCLKKVPYNVDLNSNGTFVSFPLGGISNFSSDAITASQDTVVDTVEAYYTGASLPTQPIVITLLADFNQVANYFLIDPSIAYIPVPAGDYKIPSTVTIAAGTRTVKVPITIYKKLLDPAKSYMLPVTITAVTPYNLVATNYATHYFHIIGNPLAGPVNYLYLRYNNGIGPSAGPPSTTTLGTSVLSPVNPTTLSVATSYVGPVHYIITFTNTGGVYSNFKVSFNASDVASIWTANGISIITPPAIVTADPINGIYEFNYTVFNGTANRFIDDKYYK